MSVFCNDISQYQASKVINEAYVGKTPILEEIEKKIGELRSTIKPTDHMSRLPKVIEINRLFEKQFGMDIFALKIDPSKTPNACTYTIYRKIDIADKYEDSSKMVMADSKNGYRYKKDNNFCVIVMISYGMLMDKSLTDAEVVALLLHEIGHNFSQAIYNELYFLNRSYILGAKEIMKKNIFMNTILTIFTMGLFLPRLIQSINSYNNSKNSYNLDIEKRERNKKPNKFKGFFDNLKNKEYEKAEYNAEIAVRLQGSAMPDKRREEAFTMDPDIMKNIRRDVDRIDEVMSDKFAGIYGYGSELASVLLKTDYFKSKAYKDIEKNGTVKDKKMNLEFENAFFKVCDYDCHPYSIQRAKEVLNTLKREYEKEDVDDKVKEVLVEQMKVIESLIDENIKINKKLSESDNAKRLQNAIVNSEYPPAIEEYFEEEIEKRFDEALNNEIVKKQAKNSHNNFISTISRSLKHIKLF